MKKILEQIRFSLSLSLLTFFTSINAFAQSDDQKAISAVLSSDGLFWKAYNTCDTVGIGSFYTPDIEFYHDKGGVSKGVGSIVSSFTKNLCTDNFRLRREAIDTTIRVFLLKNQGTIYGAILSGEHLFYVLEKGKQERLDGWAKFTHTWILENTTWKMSRILSYDHKPAPYVNKRKTAKVSAAVLDKYAGKYHGPSSSEIIVKRKNEYLVQTIKGKEFYIYPETENLFFSKERDLTFEFSDGKPAGRKMIVRQNGEIVEELTLLK